MRPYEVMVILNVGLDEDVIRATVDRATQLLKSKGATLGRTDYWGRRRFAYEIQHHNEGYYVLIETTADPPVMAELDRMLHLADEVIRYKVIRVPEKTAGRGKPPTKVEAGAGAGADKGTNGA
jgi:small subunit ribosomal protein S6